MASAQKKVVVRTFTGSRLWGYLPQGGFLREDSVNLMVVDGHVNSIDISQIKSIAYVKDFNLDDMIDPERIGRRSFPARPRGDGLWLKLTFRDDDTLEGLSTVDIVFADTLLHDRGIFLTPPDARANTQRLFVPRAALRSIEVRGFVTAPSKRLPAKTSSRSTPDTQPRLFPDKNE